MISPCPYFFIQHVVQSRHLIGPLDDTYLSTKKEACAILIYYYADIKVMQMTFLFSCNVSLPLSQFDNFDRYHQPLTLLYINSIWYW